MSGESRFLCARSGQASYESHCSETGYLRIAAPKLLSVASWRLYGAECAFEHDLTRTGWLQVLSPMCFLVWLSGESSSKELCRVVAKVTC